MTLPATPSPARARAKVGRVAVGALAVLLLLGGDARADRPLRTGVAPSMQLRDGEAAVAFKRVYDAGARTVRLYLDWRHIAPTQPPPGFDPSNPADPAYNWAPVDEEIQIAIAQGLDPLVVVSEAPAWAAQGSAAFPGTVRPDPLQLRRFTHAAAVRYSGRFAGLPRVRNWIVWNEPNLVNFLAPQSEGNRLVAPDHYRRMVNEFASAVHGVHRDNLVIAGALAPFGRPGRATSPLTFMRRLLCMSKGRRPKPKCRKRTRFDVWSHHPYTSGGPTHQAVSPDDVSLGDLQDMRRLLAAAARTKRIVSRQPVRFWVDEFSWDSSPPDPNGVPADLHARWVAEALYRMWSSGISLVTWFKLRDDAPAGRPHSQVFQSGLYLRCEAGIGCDAPKHALQAFRFPFVALGNRGRVRVWGRTPDGRAGPVTIEHGSGAAWRRLATLRANRYGIFDRRLRGPRRGSLRARLPSGEAALPFSLERPPDRPVNPFG